MSPHPRPGRRLIKALLPVVLLILLALVGAMIWLAYTAAHPPRRAYLITPEQFRQLSDRGLKATDETWTNRDGTQARGWLLRGTEGSPAILMLHHYGADRSWLFNLGVKINETTNFTVLVPDLRGHGTVLPATASTFGTLESEDTMSALDYLRTLKTAQGGPLVGSRLGLYGVELGAYAALTAASKNQNVNALVLDSVPASPDELLNATVKKNTGLDNGLMPMLARTGARLYLFGRYDDSPACNLASALKNQRVLLLSGQEAGYLQAQTAELAKCFPNPSNVELKNDLQLTGLNAGSATGAQGEEYDRRIIDFYDRALRAAK